MMVGSRITAKRLKGLRGLDMEIAWCKAELDHGELVCEESLREWATQAKELLSPEDLSEAMCAAEATRARIRARQERAEQERDTLMAWIDAIPKEDVRAGMFLHYAKGYTYKAVAELYFGGTITHEAVRKMCQRCIHGLHQGKRGRAAKRKEDGQRDTGTAEEPSSD